MAEEQKQNEFEPQVVSLDAHGKLNVTCDFGAPNAERSVRLSVDVLPLESEFRGSRKHILDLLAAPDWAKKLNHIMGVNEIDFATDPRPIPGGHASVVETDLDEYIHKCRKGIWPKAEEELKRGKWWAPNGGTRPQMDLISSISVLGKDGLLFVEAKAHEGELDWGGKPLADDASEGSQGNHANIGRQIALASKELNALCGSGFNLSIKSHYQLVNRLTYLWKLASVGIPVVLVYLGFTSETYFRADYLHDERHWQRVMGGYMQGTAPHSFPEKRYDLPNGASVHMLIRSMNISDL